MKHGTYMDLVDVHYKEIIALFKSRLYNSGRHFDEDSFNDAFIKCAQRFGIDIIDYDTAIKYFWIAYMNTVKGNESKQSRYSDSTDSFDEAIHDCIDDDHDTRAEYIYNIVMDAIVEAYGEEDMMLYSLYKYHGWTIKELTDAGYDCSNIDVRVHTIHKFVKAYCKKHCK